MTTQKHTPEWLPDWKDESQYPNPQTATLSEWAWEFLRRNPDYQNAYSAQEEFYNYLEKDNSNWNDPNEILKEWEIWKRDKNVEPYQNLSSINIKDRSSTTNHHYFYFPHDLVDHFSFSKFYLGDLPAPEKRFQDFHNTTTPSFNILPVTKSGYSIYEPPNRSHRGNTQGNHIIRFDVSGRTNGEIEKLKRKIQNKPNEKMVKHGDNLFHQISTYPSLMEKEIYQKNEKHKIPIELEPMKFLCELSLDGDIDEQIANISFVAKSAQNQLKHWGLLKERRRSKDMEYYLRLLRTHDAIAKQGVICKRDIHREFFPKSTPPQDRGYDQIIDKWYKRAKKIISGNHLLVFSKFSTE